MPIQPVTIACVVEGHGEVPGLPKLLHRIARGQSIPDLRTPLPFRRNRGSLVRPGGIEAAVKAMAQQITEDGGVLVVLDADDDCPADLGPALLRRAQDARPAVATGPAGVDGLAPLGACEVGVHGAASFAQSAIISRDASGGNATARRMSYNRPWCATSSARSTTCPRPWTSR
jgi:hypothetical protein